MHILEDIKGERTVDLRTLLRAALARLLDCRNNGVMLNQREKEDEGWTGKTLNVLKCSELYAISLELMLLILTDR